MTIFRLRITVLLAMIPTLTWAQPNASQLQALMRRHHVPGMQLVYTKGTTSQSYALGLRAAGTKRPVTATTTFEAASLGKTMLAYVALRLCDQGRFDLDRPLLDYAPYPRVGSQSAARHITARLVLTHSTGLPNWAENPWGATWASSPLRFRYAPDSCWNYSGEGYVWLQHTLEQITGQSWEELARQQVCKPLGLPHSSFVWQPAFGADASAGHTSDGQPAPIEQFKQPNAGFSLYTNALEYSRFLRVLSTGQGLKPATASLLMRAINPAQRCGRVTTVADDHIDWAMGVGLVATEQGLAQWQWGDNTNFKGFFMSLPGKQESLVVLTNSAHGDELTDELLKLFFGAGHYWVVDWLSAQ
ncbi:CubicO group peptidase (beta-lactamase class C family) [Spirosoma oryzae]|uniref:CubicO group peptidase (Beta-lactamase class C family) n=1 Tax=Spirosoma oryzae TaxID=1469603 RepID=A0A2T0TEI4_9BACT|nr:serine hydrolase domain-containing protein [Spirosoma oryzae]PRY44070.1 CubicO group peptidase (beta-lactamase class C family) [Spirosoma oryzae]